MKKFSLLCLVGSCVLSLICTNANAELYDSASVVCASINSKTQQKAECFNEISKYNYFNDSVTLLCATLHSDHYKLDCIKAIGGKYYKTDQILECIGTQTDTEKLNCLNFRGER